MNWCELFFSVLKWAKFGRVRRGKNCKKQKNFRNFVPESPDGGAMVGDAFEKSKSSIDLRGFGLPFSFGFRWETTVGKGDFCGAKGANRV